MILSPGHEASAASSRASFSESDAELKSMSKKTRSGSPAASVSMSWA
jgi:hypothetical protein